MRQKNLLILIVVLLTLFIHPTFAQQNVILNIESISDDAFPTLQVEVTVTDPNHEPIRDLTIADFAAEEDGAAAEIIAVQDSDLGIAVVLVVDTSESMFALPAAREAATAFVDALRPGDEAALIDFDTNVLTVQPLTHDHETLKTAIGQALQQGGRTALYDGVLAGVREAAKSRLGRRVVVLLADGNESGDSISGRSAALEEATELGIPIYTIGLGASADRAYLENIAALTDGQYLDAPNSNQLLEVYVGLAERLRHAYLLTIVSGVPGDGENHELTIELVNGGVSARDSRAFASLEIPPQVSLAPLEAETLTGVVELTPEIRVQGSRYTVAWSLDGEVIPGQPTTPPYTLTLDTTELAPGSHTLEIEVTDAAGLSARAALAFDVATTAPQITLSGLPANRELGDATVTVRADIASQIPIVGVTFQVDGNTPQTFDTPPFSYALDPLRLGTGDHILTITVEDESGASYSEEIAFTSSISAPVIALRGVPATPAEQPFTVQAEITAERPAEATWYLNGEVVTPRLQNGVYSLEIDPADYEPGVYTLSVTAQDDRGSRQKRSKAVLKLPHCRHASPLAGCLLAGS